MAECKDLKPSFCELGLKAIFPDICSYHESSSDVCEAVICTSHIGCAPEPSRYTCQAMTCQSKTATCTE